MASRVNLKFVFVLGGAMILIATGVVYFGLKNYMPGGEQNIERGRQAEKDGDLQLAIQYYGRAVNKDRSNVEWVRIWLEAIQKCTPTNRKAYEDMYFGDYMGAIRAMADADRRSVAAFRRYLEERYQLWQQQASTLGNWEACEREYRDIVALFQGSEAEKKALARYEGFAISGQLAHNPDLSQEKVTKGLSDLKGALEADPRDREVRVALSSMQHAQADRAARTGHQAEADKILADSRKDLEAFLASDKDALRVRFTLLTLDLVASAKSDGKETMLELLKRNSAAIGVLADAINATPPEKTDYQVALLVAPWVGLIFDDNAKRMDDMLEHVRAGHADDASFLLRWAQLEMSRNKLDKAIALEKQVVALPDKPMSLDGFILIHILRIKAVQMQADAWFARTQIEADAAKKAEAVQNLRDIRTDLAARVGESDNAVLSIDARLDYLSGDFLGARTRVSKYNDQTQQTDADMVMFEAQLLNQLGQRGAAKTKYERVLALQKQNVRALAALGLIEAGERDYRAAYSHLSVASAMVPDDTRLKELTENTRRLRDGDTKDDPVLGCMMRAEDAGLGITGDIQASIKIIRDCMKDNPSDLRLVTLLVKYLMAAQDVDGAKAALDDAIRRNPDNANIKSARARIDRDPLELFLEQINESNAPDLRKHLWRFTAYIQSNKPDEARAELAEAAKIDPNDLGVINAQFDDALMAMTKAAEKDKDKTLPEQDRLIAKARAMNIDKVGGDLFYARALMTRGKYQDAVGVLRDITGKDKLNLMAWRLLGLALLQQGRFVESVDALKTAVNIKPDDVLSIKACLQAMIYANQQGEALALARKSENVAVTDTDFFETYLALEANAVGGDKNKAIDARKRLAERRPANRPNKTRLASLLINASRTDEAAKLIDDLLKEDPNDPVAVQLKSALLGRQGDVPGAVKFLQNFIAARKPDDRTVELYINAARLMLELGQPDEAIKLLTDNRAVQEPKDPKEPKRALIDRELGDIKYNLGTTERNADKFKAYMEGSLASYQAVLDSGSEDKESAVGKRMVEVCLKAEMYDRMAQIIARLPKDVQNSATVFLLQAEAATQQSLEEKATPSDRAAQREKALRLYDQAVAADNKSPIVYLKRGGFKLMDPKTVKDALADFEQMKRVDPSNVVARIQISRVLRMLGRDEDAVKMVKDAITIEPTNPQLRLALSMMLREIGKPLEAAQAMEEAVKQFDYAKQWRLNAADFWARAGRFDKAADHLLEVWKQDRSLSVAISLIEYLLNTGNDAGVTSAYNVLQSPEVAPQIAKVLPLRMLKARVLARQGQNSAAAQEINDSLDLVKTDSLQDTTMFMSGIAGIYPDGAARLAALDRLESSKPFTNYLALKAAEMRLRAKEAHAASIASLLALTASASNDQIKASAWSLLGTDSYANEKWDEARERFDKGVKLDPQNAELNNNLAYILAAKLNRCDEALAYAQTAAQMAPTNSGFLDTLGAAQLCAKKCDDAARTLTAGLNAALNDGERIPLYIHMGKARVCQGDTIEARRIANLARDLMNNLPEARKQYQSDWSDLDRSINAN